MVEETLTEVHRLRTRSRERAHGGAWVPALALAVLVLLSAVLYRFPFTYPHEIVAEYPYWAGLSDWQRSAPLSYAYWLVGLPAVFAATGAWYRHRARRYGVRVSWPVLVGAGLGALVLLLVLVAVPRELPPDPNALAYTTPPIWHGLATPLVAVAVAVVALGWVERSVGLAATGVWLGLLTFLGGAWGILGSFPGGQFSVRPGPALITLTLPLLIWLCAKGIRSALR
jgi:hypothetical protein